MTDKKPDIAFSTFIGFILAGGTGLVMLPVCVMFHLPPAIWGSLSIGAMPVGALLGWAWAWAQHGDDAPRQARDPWEGRTYRPRNKPSEGGDKPA